MTLRTLEDARIEKGTRVIVRADFDVAMQGGRVKDDTRIRAHEATFRALLAAGARIRVVAHLGRPGGAPDRTLTLAPVSRVLSRMLGRRVVLIRDPFSSAARKQYGGSSDILLFENIRFWPGEEKNNTACARSIAQWGDNYVNEAFANCHRAHASMVALARILPSYAGLHTCIEVAALEKVMSRVRHPLVAILGGAKIETKLPLLRKFLADADHVLLGGALANTVFSSMGKGVGKSRIDRDVSLSRSLLSHKKLCLPIDVVVTRSLTGKVGSEVRGIDDVRADDYVVDIGPRTSALFHSYIGGAKTVVWNGPMGVTEIPAYTAGTRAIAAAIGKSHAFSVVGGGDTIAALRRLKALKGFSHVSTGGGAMLEFLAGKKLPALEVLRNR